jgi:leader peptidase (prepilin peptidase) / N-methyltransferase
VWISYVVVILFGLALGSFLNVCIYRLPRHESIVTPRSHCPACQRPIRWYDNVPLLSYLWLRGRCRDCHARISPLYPFVEAATAGLGAASLARYGLTPEFVKYGVLGMLLLVLIFTDLRERRIPHVVTGVGISIGLILSFVIPVDSRPIEWVARLLGSYPEGAALSLLGSLGGALAGGGLFYGLGELFFQLGGRQKEYLGFGDVMLMFMIGTYLGPALTLLTILLGSLLGTFIAVPLEIMGRGFRHYQWPYGSFLGAAGIYVALGGSHILDAYLRWANLG